MTLNIRHHVPRVLNTARLRPCVWCGQPTPVMAETPFRPDIGALPLMLTCGALMRDAYGRAKAGLKLDSDDLAGIARLAAYSPPQLESGE